MTNSPAAIRKIREALDAIEAQVEESSTDPDIEAMDLSSDFLLESLLDALEPEDFPEMGAMAGEFLDFLARFADIA